LIKECGLDSSIPNYSGKTAGDLALKVAGASLSGEYKEVLLLMRSKSTDLDNANKSAKQETMAIADAKNESNDDYLAGKLSLESFDLIEKLGKGSFGSVFLVKKKDDFSGRYYAMKVLEKDKVLAQNLIRYAQTERAVLSLARHQFIVGLNYAFQSTSRLYLIMDYCPGGDMGMALAKHRRFNVDIARVYAAEIVLAIEYLHK